MSPNDRMTARGSSPTHEAPSDEAMTAAYAVSLRHNGFTIHAASRFLGNMGLRRGTADVGVRGVLREWLGDHGDGALREMLTRAYAVDLPSLRREAAAQAWDAAADYADGFDEPMAREFRARAQALREGR